VWSSGGKKEAQVPAAGEDTHQHGRKGKKNEAMRARFQPKAYRLGGGACEKAGVIREKGRETLRLPMNEKMKSKGASPSPIMWG